MWDTCVAFGTRGRLLAEEGLVRYLRRERALQPSAGIPPLLDNIHLHLPISIFIIIQLPREYYREARPYHFHVLISRLLKQLIPVDSH